MNATIPLLPGLAAIAGDYDGFVLDVWGVIHDGRRLYPGVVDALDRLHARGGRYVMLSNAPRRAAAVAAMLTGMGLPERHAGNILTSGESAWHALRTRTDPWHARLGRCCYHMGSGRDEGLFEDLDLEKVGTLDEADFILNTGPWRADARVADYEEALASGARLGLPMICANPDLRVMRGTAEVICAGALARRYEALGGEVCYHGKPYPAIYATALARLGGPARDRVIAIGDTVATDVAGARRAGIASALVLEGIHAREIPAAAEELAAFCEAEGAVPDFALRRLAW